MRSYWLPVSIFLIALMSFFYLKSDDVQMRSIPEPVKYTTQDVGQEKNAVVSETSKKMLDPYASEQKQANRNPELLEASRPDSQGVAPTLEQRSAEPDISPVDVIAAEEAYAQEVARQKEEAHQRFMVEEEARLEKLKAKVQTEAPVGTQADIPSGDVRK